MEAPVRVLAYKAFALVIDSRSATVSLAPRDSWEATDSVAERPPYPEPAAGIPS